MVRVGMRAWAWKRLARFMFKSIFFDALAKVMTWSSVQLSLYGQIRDNQDSSLQKVYQRNELQAQLEARKASSSVFGDLQYKLELLETNNTEKQVQLESVGVHTPHKEEKRTTAELALLQLISRCSWILWSKEPAAGGQGRPAGCVDSHRPRRAAPGRLPVT
jgi:hypothetical protein